MATSSLSTTDPKPLNPFAESFFPVSVLVPHFTFDPQLFHPEQPSQPLFERQLLVPAAASLVYQPPGYLWNFNPANMRCYDSYMQPLPPGFVPQTAGCVARVCESVQDAREVNEGSKTSARNSGSHGMYNLLEAPRSQLQRDMVLVPASRKSRVFVPRKRGERKGILGARPDAGGLTTASTPASDDRTNIFGCTSIMIKNIPNEMGRSELEAILDEHCRAQNRKGKSQSGFCKSEYDFLYLPMDFRFNLNLGYAFVNFTNAAAAMRFYHEYDGVQMMHRKHKKICRITRAEVQGLEALRKKFAGSRFPCRFHSYLPEIFSPPRDGFRQSKCTNLGILMTSADCSSRDLSIMTIRRRRRLAKLG